MYYASDMISECSKKDKFNQDIVITQQATKGVHNIFYYLLLNINNIY